MKTSFFSQTNELRLVTYEILPGKYEVTFTDITLNNKVKVNISVDLFTIKPILKTKLTPRCDEKSIFETILRFTHPSGMKPSFGNLSQKKLKTTLKEENQTNRNCLHGSISNGIKETMFLDLL